VFVPLGKNWAATFVRCHAEQVTTYWSSTLSNTRAHSLNLRTKQGWDDLVEAALAGNFSDGVSILPENIAGFDETGFMPGIRPTRRVIGAVGKNLQHEVRTGGREMATLMATIMADGTSTRPVLIFKGVNIQSKWGHADKSRNVANVQ
jgi:hypothetical protein